MSRGRGGRRGAKSAVMTMFKQTKEAPATPGLISNLQSGQSMIGYPSLDVRRLAPVVTNQAHEYMVTVRAQQTSRMRESPYFLKSTRRKRELSRYSDRSSGNKGSDEKELDIDPRMLPTELLWKQANAKAPRLSRAPGPADEDISAIIARLEQADVAPLGEEAAEGLAGREEGPARADRHGSFSGEEDDEEEGEVGALVIDDFGEDDEDNDYVQSYFDNGEAYAHEDDMGGAADDPFD